MLYADTLYEGFLKRAALRLSKGESNVLEKATAENQLNLIKIQLDQLKSDQALAQLQFQLLLNTTEEYLPIADTYLIVEAKSQTDIDFKSHPILKQMEQHKEVVNAAVKVEQSKLLPELLLGINNGSIRGVGANNKSYSAAYRFSSIQAGVAVPIFTKAQKAKIQATKFSTQVAESSYDAELQQLEAAYKSQLLLQQKYASTVSYYENNSLKTAKLIVNTANQQLALGSINYLEWVQLVNQSIATQNEYFETIKSLNEATIQLHYFKN